MTETLALTESPESRLAKRLGGELQKSGAIIWGDHIVSCSIAGIVRFDGKRIGSWRDSTDDLAAAAGLLRWPTSHVEQARRDLVITPGGATAHGQPPILRALGRVEVVSGGCWEFSGSRCRSGHARMRVASGGHAASVLVHRLSYEHFVGPIPDGLLVCHRCDNPPCMNPAHLFVGTQADNMKDCWDKGRTGGLSSVANKRKTVCKRGHAFDAVNTIWRSDGKGRRCRACRDEDNAARYSRPARARLVAVAS